MKLKLLIPFLGIIGIVNAQEIFPANDTSLISGKELKVKSREGALQSIGYEGFYTDEKLKKKFESDGFSSKYSSLVGKTFKVVNIVPYKDVINNQKFKLKLFNSETGEIFYDYDPRYKHQWHFEILGDLNLPKDFFCTGITMTADKFTGDTTYRTEASDGIWFIKVKKEKKETYYFSKNQPGSTLNVGQKGLILLLENNKRIEKPDAELDVKVSSYGSSWIYNAFIELTDDDIKLLTENAITDTRLYIYDDTIKDGKKLIEYLKCLLLK